MLVNLLVAATIAMSAPSVPGWAQGDLQPAADEAYSVDLESQGFVNGRMPDTRLLAVGSCVLERDAAYAFALMSETARVDGVVLDPGDCYRSYAAQDAVRSRRCEDEVREVTALDAVTGEVTVVSRETVTVCEGPPTAPAGSSNHGWGRAIDFTAGGRSLGCGDEAFVWLQQNGAAFGWVHPAWAHCGRSTEEAWHWEWAGVQEVPPVLSGLAFEGSAAFPISLVPESRVR